MAGGVFRVLHPRHCIGAGGVSSNTVASRAFADVVAHSRSLVTGASGRYYSRWWWKQKLSGSSDSILHDACRPILLHVSSWSLDVTDFCVKHAARCFSVRVRVFHILDCTLPCGSPTHSCGGTNDVDQTRQSNTSSSTGRTLSCSAIRVGPCSSVLVWAMFFHTARYSCNRMDARSPCFGGLCADNLFRLHSASRSPPIGPTVSLVSTQRPALAREVRIAAKTRPSLCTCRRH